MTAHCGARGETHVWMWRQIRCETPGYGQVLQDISLRRYSRSTSSELALGGSLVKAQREGACNKSQPIAITAPKAFCSLSLSPLSRRYPPSHSPLSKLDLFTNYRIRSPRLLNEKTVHAPTHLDRIMALRATVRDSH